MTHRLRTAVLNTFELEKKNINTCPFGTSSIERPQEMADVEAEGGNSML